VAERAPLRTSQGIKVQWEMLPKHPWRQTVKVEHLAGAIDLDVYLRYPPQQGEQLFTPRDWGMRRSKPIVSDGSGEVLE
jgi:hypothetical protein